MCLRAVNYPNNPSISSSRPYQAASPSYASSEAVLFSVFDRLRGEWHLYVVTSLTGPLGENCITFCLDGPQGTPCVPSAWPFSLGAHEGGDSKWSGPRAKSTFRGCTRVDTPSTLIASGDPNEGYAGRVSSSILNSQLARPQSGTSSSLPALCHFLRRPQTSRKNPHHWSKNTTISIIVPTALTAMTAIPIIRQSAACPWATPEPELTGGRGSGEGYRVGLAVFWLALVAVMLVCVPPPSRTGVGDSEVDVWVGVRCRCEERPVKTVVVSCAVLCAAGVGWRSAEVPIST